MRHELAANMTLVQRLLDDAQATENRIAQLILYADDQNNLVTLPYLQLLLPDAHACACLDCEPRSRDLIKAVVAEEIRPQLEAELRHTITLEIQDDIENRVKRVMEAEMEAKVEARIAQIQMEKQKELENQQLQQQTAQAAETARIDEYLQARDQWAVKNTPIKIVNYASDETPLLQPQNGLWAQVYSGITMRDGSYTSLDASHIRALSDTQAFYCMPANPTLAEWENDVANWKLRLQQLKESDEAEYKRLTDQYNEFIKPAAMEKRWLEITNAEEWESMPATLISSELHPAWGAGDEWVAHCENRSSWPELPQSSRHYKKYTSRLSELESEKTAGLKQQLLDAIRPRLDQSLSLRAKLVEEAKDIKPASSLALALRLLETTVELPRLFVEASDEELTAEGVPSPPAPLDELSTKLRNQTMTARSATLASRARADQLAKEAGFATSWDRYLHYHSTVANEEEIDRMGMVFRWEQQYWKEGSWASNAGADIKLS